MLNQLKKDLQKLANPEKAKLLSGFFRTGKGQYGEDDIFLGIVVPDQRKTAKKYPELQLNEIQELLSNKIHEYRLTSLFILISKFERGNNKLKKEIFEFYLQNAKNINNWDLVDLSAPKIPGAYILDNPKEKKILYKLAESKNLWEKRIAILSTYTFIKNHEFEDTLNISEILLKDKHDLIHKAVGWMLREIGKKDQKTEEKFLKKHCREMPRTMLRYAIEKFQKNKKEFYMKK
ncbi:DNA alkylation repair protein [Candidatus Woesearchaeota archaeon CG_4_10_14_0_2_um_filter_33_10]|nr:MAG: DNA alkylation repair protein [Candidatus Woesearchaeota archaeon CG1_02_33_12]PIN79020.1 MAG: DNA alkylation repair protein [Candidatus Woesearchaeota archaeon CG10_big_fil_rev_8_21_14_0_10_33_12]PIU72711.1 MAG: DNA alkylation repair protein [Candidatus Woesearchaeota archaeon CG06_land_8_20_14_3_00_33_13]PIZ52599.1 MAG: DNA alkylation repair protein [Candidatus Woesearchaeota archaeon CG_4_10_14_0_2_um_filter_33_10]